MRFPLSSSCLLMLAVAQQAKADLMYGYSIGVSLHNTIIPNTSVSIEAVLLNTGSIPIVFAPGFPGGPPSVQGGSTPFAGLNATGQWSILESGFSFGDFFGQFAGVTVLPGDTFPFAVGTFLAPSNQPLGTTATPAVNFGISFTDTIWGNLLAICPGACSYNNAPTMTFTLGNVASTSDIVFFQGIVVDVEHPVIDTGQIPEPSTWLLLTTVIALTLTGVRRASRT
jgi:hypothetical protein